MSAQSKPTEKAMLLNEKIVLVTGGGRGIGHAIVMAALREGALVVAHVGRNKTADSIFNHSRVLEVHADFSSQAETEAVWAEAINWYGRVDVLVNNAGVYVASPLDDDDFWMQGWQTNLMINLEAPATLCRHAVRHFEQTGEGIIVNMASRSSHRGDDAEHLAYGAAKGGLLALTRGLARSFAARGTLAYAVAPGWVRTEMAEQHIASVGEKNITAALPMGEVTPPADVAETVVFLASGRARHATGSTIDITGADYVR